jgi:UDP-2,3-diacylglucosamine pyrophosphatase LpxH
MSALNSRLPRYYGKSWIRPRLPCEAKDWSHGKNKSIEDEKTTQNNLVSTLKTLNQSNVWRWPKRKHYFFSDLHGDSEAFAASLVASGGVKKKGPKPEDFILTRVGKEANFIIGGDCFDKGPSSLGLLRTVRHLKKQGARVRVLAGNHDVRVLFGMVSVSHKKDILNEHFFIRTGEKIIPLLKEVWEDYLKDKSGLKNIPDKKECRRRLYPRKKWFADFPAAAAGKLIGPQIERELDRIQKKYDRFENECEKAGLTLRHVYAAVEKWKELFLVSGEEFHWFYKYMRLAYSSGSLLFIHAGLDNDIAALLRSKGVKELNHIFRRALFESPFDFYYGSLCNTIRTKYRNVDHPFTKKGARHLRHAGISAIIHGHRNLYHGQRIALRQSVLNFECDTSLDKHTRKKEGVPGLGASATIIEPDGRILGISSDYPYIKVFHPLRTLKEISKQEMRRVKNETK